MIHASGDRQDIIHRALEDLQGILPDFRSRFAQQPLELGARRAAPGHVIPQALKARQQAVRRRVRQLTHCFGRQTEADIIVIHVFRHVINTWFGGEGDSYASIVRRLAC